MKVGIFLNDELIDEYPLAPDFFVEIYDQAKTATLETGVVHEVKLFEDPTMG